MAAKGTPIASQLAALMTEVWTIEENPEKLKPTGMAGGVQPNGSNSRMDKVNGPALRRLPCRCPPAAHPAGLGL
jgi:hypothetical protein